MRLVHHSQVLSFLTHPPTLIIGTAHSDIYHGFKFKFLQYCIVSLQKTGKVQVKKTHGGHINGESTGGKMNTAADLHSQRGLMEERTSNVSESDIRIRSLLASELPAW